jgi:hypothetical protein
VLKGSERFWSGVALGLAVALGFALAGSRAPLREALGQTAGNNEFVGLLGSGPGAGEHSVVFLDAKSNRMAVYNLKANELSLVAVRNIAYDLKFEEVGVNQKPHVAEMRQEALKLAPAP